MVTAFLIGSMCSVMFWMRSIYIACIVQVWKEGNLTVMGGEGFLLGSWMGSSSVWAVATHMAAYAMQGEYFSYVQAQTSVFLQKS